jgi:hypothetical protein
MQVVVEIDLVRDAALMSVDHEKIDPQITAMIKHYNSLDEGPESDTYLLYLGRQLWAYSNFPATIDEIICPKSMGAITQVQPMLFSFTTYQEYACLFRLACHAPIAVAILDKPSVTKRASRSELASRKNW